MRTRSAHLAGLGLFVLSLVTAKSSFGEACSQANSHLDSNTWALDTDCDATTYCAANGTCANKGCRKDVYPYGYNSVAFDKLPPLCAITQFCPDEGDQCLPLVPVGGACQKDRDDECAPPSNWKDLQGYLNVNGSVCLDFICQYANATVGQTCIIENTVYNAYTEAGDEYSYIVSRDNCANGFYCDGSALQCLRGKSFGVSCSGNKECVSYNCLSGATCGRAADEPVQAASWVYVLVGLGIIALIGGTMVSLWLAHRRQRSENQIKLEQYYNEQLAYRQSIMSMSHAKNALFTQPQTPAQPPQAYSDPRGSPNDSNYAFSSSVDMALPPNMRRESSAVWSESGDSEVLLVPEGGGSGLGSGTGGRRWR